MQKVSIIIPCYNKGEYLHEAVESALHSSYKKIEIIIVNDGSSDNTDKIARQLSTKYGNIIYISQKNHEAPTARNNGIKQSSGEYILPLDADDKISADYIEKAVDVLNKNDSVKVVYCNAEYFGMASGKLKLPDFSLNLLARKNMIFISSLYRKNEWKKINGYEERMTWGFEDWELWISMLKSGGDVVKLPICGFYYRITNNSLRKQVGRSGKIKTIELLNSKHKDFLHSKLNGPLRYRRSLSKIINTLSRKL